MTLQFKAGLQNLWKRYDHTEALVKMAQLLASEKEK